MQLFLLYLPGCCCDLDHRAEEERNRHKGAGSGCIINVLTATHYDYIVSYI